MANSFNILRCRCHPSTSSTRSIRSWFKPHDFSTSTFLSSRGHVHTGQHKCSFFGFRSSTHEFFQICTLPWPRFSCTIQFWWRAISCVHSWPSFWSISQRCHAGRSVSSLLSPLSLSIYWPTTHRVSLIFITFTLSGAPVSSPSNWNHRVAPGTASGSSFAPVSVADSSHHQNLHTMVCYLCQLFSLIYLPLVFFFTFILFNLSFSFSHSLTRYSPPSSLYYACHSFTFACIIAIETRPISLCCTTFTHVFFLFLVPPTSLFLFLLRFTRSAHNFVRSSISLPLNFSPSLSSSLSLSHLWLNWCMLHDSRLHYHWKFILNTKHSAVNLNFFVTQCCILSCLLVITKFHPACCLFFSSCIRQCFLLLLLLLPRPFLTYLYHVELIFICYFVSLFLPSPYVI